MSDIKTTKELLLYGNRKINIPNYELEKLAKFLLPQILEDFNKWQQEQIKQVDKSES